MVKSNLYYYFFYRISKVLKAISFRKKGADYFENGCAFFSLCQTLNILSVLFFAQHFLHFKISSSYFFSAIICLPIWFLNRKILLTKKDKIFKFFDNSLKKTRILDLYLTFYLIFSYAIPIFFAIMYRYGLW